MRALLILSVALIPVLLQPAAAQAATDWSEEQLTSDGIAPADAESATTRSRTTKRPSIKPAASRKAANAKAAAVGPQPPPPVLKDLVIESMDLRQIEHSIGAFSIPIIAAPPAAVPPVPSPVASTPSASGPPASDGSTPDPAATDPVAAGFAGSALSPPPNPTVQANTAAAQAQADTFPPAASSQKSAIGIEPVVGSEPAIMLRADPGVGLAAFRLGTDALIVLDTPILFQAGADLDPAFAGLTSRRTQDATLIRIPAVAGLRLARTTRGWLVTIGAPSDGATTILPQLIQGGTDASPVRLMASEPSRVVTVLNPETGSRLLVGTVGAAGQAVPSAWAQIQFSLLPTLQGVVVAPLSDDIRLRRESNGFMLSASQQADGGNEGIWQTASDLPTDASLTRLFDFPNGTTKELSVLLSERIQTAGRTHTLARSGPRLLVAEAMLALGMDVEAQAVIDVAAAADPAVMDQPLAIGLRTVAATLAGRIDDAKPLADTRLTGSTEIDLWRALLRVVQDDVAAKDALSLARGLPLVLRYPAALRDRLLPGALEAMVLNGQAEAAGTVLRASRDDRNLELARAIALDQDSQAAEALKIYDQVASRADRLSRYKALVRATELRIKSGELDARAGADALDHALLGWRGAKQEFGLRLRIAELRGQANQWREALTVLRDGREIFPEKRVQLDQKMAAILTGLLNNDAARHLSPIDFVTIYDQNLDLVRDIAWTEKTGVDLVEHLVGLNLQGRAEPIMARLVTRCTDSVRRAALGARLASLRISLDDSAGAIAALSSTVPPAGAAADPGTMRLRQLLYARAEAQRGNKDAALTLLNGLDNADADEIRAQIYTARKDWVQVVGALTALEHGQTMTATLTMPQQAIVMRLAVAATLSGDSATLARLSGSYGTAMAKGSSGSLFRLMTSAPARGTGDLPRAFEEIQLAKQLEGRIGLAARP